MVQKADSGEAGPRIRGGDGGQGITDGSADALLSASASAAQRLFGLGKCLLDRVEVRGGGGQKVDLTAGGRHDRWDDDHTAEFRAQMEAMERRLSARAASRGRPSTG